MTNVRVVFWKACLLEAGLGIIAVGAGLVFHRPLWQLVLGPISHALWGALVALPMLAVIILIMRLRMDWLEPIHTFMDACIRPLFGTCHWAELFLISLLAGVGEELLFRGVIQDWLASTLNPLAGLVLASLLFGLVHCVNFPYTVLTGLVGLGLGAMFQWSGSLIMPTTAHVTYDFLALLWFVRVEPKLKTHHE